MRTISMRHLSFFKSFLTIFVFRRSSKTFKIHYKNEVILNIRILHSLDTMIWKGIENSSRDSAKNIEFLTQNEAQNASEREPLPDTVFGEHFGTILAPFGVHFCTHSAPKAIKIVPKSPLKRALDFHYFFKKPLEKLHPPWAVGGPGVVPHLVKAMVFDAIDVFASTGSQILKILILSATLPRDKSL